MSAHAHAFIIKRSQTVYRRQLRFFCAHNGTRTLLAGYYGKNGTAPCSACSLGQFVAAMRATACTACGPGTFMDATGANNCTNCTAGRYSNKTGARKPLACRLCLGSPQRSSLCPLRCKAGTFSETGRANYGTVFLNKSSSLKMLQRGCRRCSAGRYAGSGARACANCTAGKYNELTGAKSSAACIDCPVGTYSGSVGARGSILCQHCSTGRFGNTTGATSNNTCMDCAAGLYGFSVARPSAAPSTSPTARPTANPSTSSASPTRKKLSGGRTAAPTQSPTTMPTASPSSKAPTASPTANPTASATTRRPRNESQACLRCAAGTYSNVTAAQSVRACLRCAPGMFGGSGATACTSCSAGTYNGDSGARTGACRPCAVGTYSARGAVACTNCSAGEYGSSRAGTGATNSSACLPCSRGRFSTLAGANSSAVCVKCRPGTYGPGLRLTVCTYCRAGRFGTRRGSARRLSACSNCALGTFAMSTGATRCAACPSGRFSAVPGKPLCTPCAAGRFAADNNSRHTAEGDACRQCAAGRHGTIWGSTTPKACSACPSGRYSAVGATVCSMCTLYRVVTATLHGAPGDCNASLPVGSKCTASCDQGYGTQFPSVTCEPSLCVFANGNGVGGSETRLGSTASAVECASRVKVLRPFAVGATWGRRSGACFAEFGMTKRNKNVRYRSCLFDESCSQHDSRMALASVLTAGLTLHTSPASRAVNSTYFRTNSVQECQTLCRLASACYGYTRLDSGFGAAVGACALWTMAEAAAWKRVPPSSWGQQNGTTSGVCKTSNALDPYEWWKPDVVCQGRSGERKHGGPKWPSPVSSSEAGRLACQSACNARANCSHYVWFFDMSCRTYTSCTSTSRASANLSRSFAFRRLSKTPTRRSAVLRSIVSAHHLLTGEIWVDSHLTGQVQNGSALYFACGGYSAQRSIKSLVFRAGRDWLTGEKTTRVVLSANLTGTCRANTPGHTVSLRRQNSDRDAPGTRVLAAIKCTELSCAGLKAPSNGGFGDCSTNGTLAHGGNCTLACDAGYRMMGGGSVTCALGRLSTLAKCVAVVCSDSTVNGSSTVCKGKTGDTCSYVCKNRTSASGSAVPSFAQGVHRCQTSGKFSGGSCVQSKAASIETTPRVLTANVPQFGTTIVSFNVTNGGAADLYLALVRSNQTWATPFQLSPSVPLNLKKPIKPMNSTTFKVLLVGSGGCCGPGLYVAGLVLVSNDPEKPKVVVEMRMTVFQSALTLVPIPDTFEIFDMPPASSGVVTPQILSLYNFHGTSLQWWLPGCNGTYLTVASWAVVQPCSGVLAAGGNVPIMVRVKPGVSIGVYASAFDIVCHLSAWSVQIWAPNLGAETNVFRLHRKDTGRNFSFMGELCGLKLIVRPNILEPRSRSPRQLWRAPLACV